MEDLNAGRFDLHIHSLFSDGNTTPARNAALAAQAGLAGMALTDHDTLAGWDQARQACQQHGIAFVPGLELSTELDGRGVHLLGYWVEGGNEELRAECDRLRNERLRRAEAVVAKLVDQGAPIPLSAVLAQAGTAPVGRPHIAAALVAAGMVPDMDTAFTRYLADGGPAYVPKHALPPERGVELIVRAGGAAVLAHPALGSREGHVDLALLDRLVIAGLAGVEADHAGHDAQARDVWRAAAAVRGLLVTGSSDFHGLLDGPRIGDATTGAEVVRQLQRQAATTREQETVVVGPAKRLTPLPMFVVTSDGPLRGRVLVVDSDEQVLGRRENSGLVLSDPHVSRAHAVIRRSSGAVWLEDLGSTGGTFVNGEAVIGSRALRHGDAVRFGTVDTRFEDRSAMMDDTEQATQMIPAPAAADKPVLSPRQQEVLNYLKDGLTNPEIATRLGVTERTVKAHCQEVFDRLGARNRTAAVAEAMRMGLVGD